jgi:hypothetical protein
MDNPEKDQPRLWEEDLAPFRNLPVSKRFLNYLEALRPDLVSSMRAHVRDGKITEACLVEGAIDAYDDIKAWFYPPVRPVEEVEAPFVHPAALRKDRT